MQVDFTRIADGRLVKNAGAMYAEATMKSTHSKRSAGVLGGDVSLAFPKVFDPGRRGMGADGYGPNGGGIDILSFDDDENTRKTVLMGCRNIAKTHPVIKACIEVYSRYPIQGLSLKHDNRDVERLYRELFIEDLDFETFLTDVGKVYWTDGSAFVYGNWSDSLGLWVGEDILDPIGIKIERLPFMSEDLVYMVPSNELKSLVGSSDQSAIMFRKKFPDMARAILSGSDIPLSSDRLTYIANKDRPSELWGTPVMLRCWNTLRLEDRMNAAMQATADRLYAPLVMFTIGGLMPDGNQFIPSASMLDEFRNNLDAALAADFRAIVTHSGVSAQEVIKGDRMSNFKQDSDMYDERIFMAWGLSSSILKPQSGPYATSAMEFQLASQMLSTYQRVLVSVYNKQAAFVAEAHEHYEYEKKGDSLKVVYEKKEVWDEEADDGNGAYVVKDVPKLSYPRMEFDVINFRDEQKERNFLMELRKAGLPIADEDIAIGVDIDLESSSEKYNEERIKRAVDEARIQNSIFTSTVEQGIPVPPDTKRYMEQGIVPFKFQKLTEKFQDTYDADAMKDDGDSEAGDGEFEYDPLASDTISVSEETSDALSGDVY